jgi:hypothetical protein
MVYLPLPQTGTLGLLLEMCPVVLSEKNQWKMLLGILLGLSMHVGHLHLLEKCTCIFNVMLAPITGEVSMVTRWSYHHLICRAFPYLHLHGLQLLLQPLVLFFCNMQQCLQSNILCLKHLVDLFKLIEP